ncbi:MAG: sigma-70 family RNA polymerase sigma factor [Phycisphaerales bacterium]|nr:sigma-70 family RNA polymerase sigma factor [Phycisphaerales bacterium]
MSSFRDASPSTHVSLLKRIRAGGDQDAWAEFRRRYHEFLVRFCRRRGLQPADAEDVVQGVFLALARALPAFTYDPTIGRFRDYLFRAVRNAISRWRNCPERRTEQLSMFEGLLTAAADRLHAASDEEQDQWEREWAAHHYRLALARLRRDGDERMVRILERSLEGATSDELAGEFGLTHEAVYKLRSRARQRVQELVEEQIREEDGVSSRLEA